MSGGNCNYSITEEHVYCTNCQHFRLDLYEKPYCCLEDYCDIFNCEDSKPLRQRPHYRDLNGGRGMIKQFQVDREILMYAMRYALGRMTFAPITIIENIKYNIDLFSEGDLEIFIRDIEEQESYGEQALGMNCDVETWLNFKQFLKNKIKLKVENDSKI